MRRTKDEAVDYLERLKELHSSNSREARKEGNLKEFYYQAGLKDAIDEVLGVVKNIAD